MAVEGDRGHFWLSYWHYYTQMEVRMEVREEAFDEAKRSRVAHRRDSKVGTSFIDMTQFLWSAPLDCNYHFDLTLFIIRFLFLRSYSYERQFARLLQLPAKSPRFPPSRLPAKVVPYKLWQSLRDCLRLPEIVPMRYPNFFIE